jgi:hypothetical protein
MPEKIATAVGDLKIVGAEYTPIAYLGSQVVNGINHAVLAEQLVVAGKDTKNVVVIMFNERPEGVTLVGIERVLESGGELALAVISDLCGYLGDGETGACEKLGCVLHPMLFYMRGKGIAVHGFEDGFEGGGVHMKLFGQGFDGDLLVQMLQQVLMDFVDEIDLIGPAVGQKNSLLRAGDAHGLLDHVMQQLDHLKVAGPVKDLLALSSANDEAGIAQGAEMV